jgi:hypothetical protein
MSMTMPVNANGCFEPETEAELTSGLGGCPSQSLSRGFPRAYPPPPRSLPYYRF